MSPNTAINVDLKFTTPDDERSVLVELNPTISHNSFKSYWCIITGCNPFRGNPHKHVPPVSANAALNRSLEVKKNEPGVDLIQLWSWDLSKDHMDESIKMIGSRLYPGLFYDDCNLSSCLHVEEDEDKHMLVITEDPLSRGVYDEGMLSSVLIGLSSELSSAYPSDHIVIRLRRDRWSHGITALEDAGFIAISDSPEPLIVWSSGDNAVISDDNTVDMIENGWLPVPTPGFVEYERA